MNDNGESFDNDLKELYKAKNNYFSSLLPVKVVYSIERSRLLWEK